MPMPDEKRLVYELNLIRNMCCDEHRIQEIDTLIEKIKAPVSK